MLVKKIMNVLKNLFGLNKKIAASEIAMKDSNSKAKTLDEILGNLSNLNTTDKSNLINAVNEINGKSFIQIKKSENSNFSLADYGSTDIPLLEEEFKKGEKLALVDGAIKNVSSETLLVEINYAISSSTSFSGYILACPTNKSYLLMPFSTATNMGTGLNFTIISEIEPNDTIKLRVGNSSAVTVTINKATRISAREL